MAQTVASDPHYLCGTVHSPPCSTDDHWQQLLHLSMKRRAYGDALMALRKYDEASMNYLVARILAEVSECYA